MNMRPNKPILLVEDDVVDVMTLKRALKQLNVVNHLTVMSNGEDALEYLRNVGRERPGIILLDLNMPRMNGIEFLKILKSDDRLKTIPVVVLTTSTQYQDKLESFNLSVAGYMVKPVDYEKFVDMMRKIHAYWIISELPEEI